MKQQLATAESTIKLQADAIAAQIQADQSRAMNSGMQVRVAEQHPVQQLETPLFAEEIGGQPVPNELQDEDTLLGTLRSSTGATHIAAMMPEHLSNVPAKQVSPEKREQLPEEQLRESDETADLMTLPVLQDLGDASTVVSDQIDSGDDEELVAIQAELLAEPEFESNSEDEEDSGLEPELVSGSRSESSPGVDLDSEPEPELSQKRIRNPRVRQGSFDLETETTTDISAAIAEATVIADTVAPFTERIDMQEPDEVQQEVQMFDRPDVLQASEVAELRSERQAERLTALQEKAVELGVVSMKSTILSMKGHHLGPILD